MTFLGGYTLAEDLVFLAFIILFVMASFTILYCLGSGAFKAWSWGNAKVKERKLKRAATDAASINSDSELLF